MTRTALEATSALYQAGPGIRLTRLALGASQRLWPALAVRAACRLFLTPLPPKWLHRRRAWDPSWRVEAWPFEQAGLTVYSRPNAPHGPVALLVHGWGGHAGQLLALADALAAQGLRPVILEMPAHGRSLGRQSTLPQFARAIEYTAARLRQQGFTLRALVAHSLGASAAAYVASRGLPIERLVLLAPPASPPEYTRLFAQVFGLSEATRAAMQRRIEAREGLLMPQFEAAAVAPAVRVATLVVHDRQDGINRFADGQAYAAAIPGALLLPTEGLGHRKGLKDAAVLEQVARFAM
jgi:alpha-beta hydrolase superfamily lysophospholipase